jgi:hypothetical protein
LGATRKMILQAKDKTMRRKQRFALPHNSLFVLGWTTNRQWTHEIKQDKRPYPEKEEDELRDEGLRISLTFRSISTYLHQQTKQLYGQGAPRKERPVIDGEDTSAPSDKMGEEDASMRMLQAFSNENKQSDFNWDENYSCGFSALNFKVLNKSDTTEEKTHPCSGGEQDT